MIDLDRVVVVKAMVFPLVLGIEWIVQSGAVVKGVGGKAEVTVPSSNSTKPMRKEDLSSKMLAQKLASISEDESEEDRADAFSQEAENLKVLGAIISEASLSPPVRPKSYLKPMRTRRIPAGNWETFSCRVPNANQPLWMVPTVGSSTVGKEWISPRCVLAADKGVVHVPIINLGESALGWRRTRGLWKAIEISETKIEPVETNDNRDVIGAVQDGLPVPGSLLSSNLEGVNFNEDLPVNEKEELFTLLAKHERCFSQKKGKTHLAEHFNETGNAPPIRSVPYRVSEAERAIIAEQVNKMLKDDVIRPSSSPWSSPVVLVRKPNKELRFCVDYRRLNAVTLRDVYPLPRVDDILGRLSGAKYFTSLDLQKGFWQLPVTKDHQEKTAFVTTDGLYEFLCMPFGLCGAPPSFQRLMDRVLGSLKWTECLCYMDDILIYGTDFKEHQTRLDHVLQVIGDAGLTLNVKKCVFAVSRVAHLGHLVDGECVRPDPAKIEAVVNYPRPETITQLRAFLGLAAYYRQFVQGFAGIAKPLHWLLKKGADVLADWGPDQEFAFRDIKEKLTTAPVLVCDDGKSEVELQTDASHRGIGAVLLIKTQEGNRPITFVSRKLTPAEGNYHANELECLALVWSLNKLRHYAMVDN